MFFILVRSHYMGYQFSYNVSVINEGNTSTKIKNKGRDLPLSAKRQKGIYYEEDYSLPVHRQPYGWYYLRI